MFPSHFHGHNFSQPEYEAACMLLEMNELDPGSSTTTTTTTTTPTMLTTTTTTTTLIAGGNQDDSQDQNRTQKCELCEIFGRMADWACQWGFGYVWLLELKRSQQLQQQQEEEEMRYSAITTENPDPPRGPDVIADPSTSTSTPEYTYPDISYLGNRIPWSEFPEEAYYKSNFWETEESTYYLLTYYPDDISENSTAAFSYPSPVLSELEPEEAQVVATTA